jgi:glycosyltransferase involved in cell wall biosynthesis
MHIVFVHQNFPAQFGHIADYLARHKGFRCTFVSEKPGGRIGALERIQYRIQGGATERTHYCSRTFENTIWHTHAVFEALKARPDVKPDLIVGHSGFGSTLFLRELHNVPIINYFEYFYRARNSDMDFRPDFPSTELNGLRARARNAMLLLDLENCDAGYSPTEWQRGRLPRLFHDKVRVIFDGIDTNVWKPMPGLPRQLGERTLPDDVKLVTYATRGMESMRGFDIFMRFAKRLGELRKDVLFLIAGEDRVCYGGDHSVTGGQSFKQWVLSRDDYDLSRFIFLGLIPPSMLAQLFNLTNLHVYLTVPFVLSWSLMDALACGTTVLASDTAPVREMIEHGKNGLLAGFFDVDRMIELAMDVLDAPDDFRHLGKAGAAQVREHYSLDVCLPRMLTLYEEVLAGGPQGP